MEFAVKEDLKEIVDLYRNVIEEVNKTSVRLGWNIDIYPNEEFVRNSIEKGEMCISRKDGRIVAVAAVNHNVNKEYDDIEWEIEGPKDKIATIHAFTVVPDKRGGAISSGMLADIAKFCKENGDLAIHLDVIDTNIPAYKMYSQNGYKEVDCIKMFYDVVGTREFWMMECIL